MKILWIVKKYFDISLDKTTWVAMINCLKHQGHKIVFFTGYKKNKDITLNINEIKLFPSIKIPGFHYITLSISIFFNAVRYILTQKPNVLILCHMSGLLGFLLKYIAVLFNIKLILILDIRSIPVETEGLKGTISLLLYNLNIILAKYFFNGITVISKEMKRYIECKYKISKDIGIWTSAVDIDIFNREKLITKNISLLNKNTNPQNKFILMYHGVITENRGLDNVIRAMRLICDINDDIMLIIIGDGNYRIKLRELVNELNISKNVVFIDSISHEEIPYYLTMCDVGILPFPYLLWWRVSSPLKLIEYLAMGKPVIVSDIEAHRLVLDKIKGVYYLKNTTPEQIKNSIICSYYDSHNFSKYSQKLRDLVIADYTWDQQTEKLTNYICNIS